MNNKVIWAIVAIIVIIGGIYLLGRNTGTDTTTGANTPSTSEQGRVVFAVTDAAVNMDTLSEVNIKVSRVNMHSQAGGWITASTTARTYNLLDLNAKNETRILADVAANADTYDQVILVIDSITVKTKAGVTKMAKLPSGEMKINTRLVVKRGETSSAKFDFLADKSLHTTGNGEYIFAPVVKTETMSSVNATTDTSGVVTLGVGSITDSSTAGMDIDGNVKLNFQLESTDKLNIDSNGLINLEGSAVLK